MATPNRTTPQWLNTSINFSTHDGSVCVDLNVGQVVISQDEGSPVIFTPETRQDAHDWALVFRKAARRLEEIGRGLE